MKSHPHLHAGDALVGLPPFPKRAIRRPLSRSLAPLLALGFLAGCGGDDSIQPIEAQARSKFGKPARDALSLATQRLNELGTVQGDDFISVFVHVADIENDGVQSLGDAAMGMMMLCNLAAPADKQALAEKAEGPQGGFFALATEMAEGGLRRSGLGPRLIHTVGLVQAAKLRHEIQEAALSAADERNGVRWRGSVTIHTETYRRMNYTPGLEAISDEFGGGFMARAFGMGDQDGTVTQSPNAAVIPEDQRVWGEWQAGPSQLLRLDAELKDGEWDCQFSILPADRSLFENAESRSVGTYAFLNTTEPAVTALHACRPDASDLKRVKNGR